MFFACTISQTKLVVYGAHSTLRGIRSSFFFFPRRSYAKFSHQLHQNSIKYPADRCSRQSENIIHHRAVWGVIFLKGNCLFFFFFFFRGISAITASELCETQDCGWFAYELMALNFLIFFSLSPRFCFYFYLQVMRPALNYGSWDFGRIKSTSNQYRIDWCDSKTFPPPNKWVLTRSLFIFAQCSDSLIMFTIKFSTSQQKKKK